GIRWRQYREIWAYVEGESWRRRAILRHFGDSSTPTAASGGDVCAPETRPIAPPPPPEVLESLDDAIFSVVRTARPSVGRTACVEILHGARSKKIKDNSYDGLGAYASASHMRRADIMARVDELLDAGRLASHGGEIPNFRGGSE